MQGVKIKWTLIRNSWNKLRPSLSNQSETLSDDTSILDANFVKLFSEISIELTESDIAEWFNEDGPGYQHLNDQGIVELVQDPIGVATDEEEDDVEHDNEPSSSHSEPVVSNAEAFHHFEKGLVWLGSMSDASPSSISTLVQLRDLAAKRRDATQVQTKISSFFKADDSTKK